MFAVSPPLAYEYEYDEHKYEYDEHKYECDETREAKGTS